MIKVSEETRKKIQNAADIVSDYSVLTQDFCSQVNDDAEASSFTAELIKAKADAIRNGEFKIVVCGKFKNGKSTFVNALLEKETMAAKATACTAVIAVVNKGTDENHVNVVYNNGKTKKLTLTDFTREFQLTDDEQHKIDAASKNGEEIIFDRFADISHVEMQSSHPMFESGCSLIDTPGLEEALARDKTTNEYLPKADAIVFMLNAIQLFSKGEREFIDAHFSGKHKKNVFFVVNRGNQLQQGQLEQYIVPAIKQGLRSCFTDESGAFDEELFNKRVYYVNAYGALCAVTGQEEQAFVGGNWQSYPVDINTTGMPEYEDSLMEFIDSDERNNAIFTSAIEMLANNFQKSVAQMRAKVSAMSMNDVERKEAAMKANASLDEAEKAVQKIEEAFARFGKLASDALFLDLMSYLDRNVKGEYAAHVKNEITAQHYKASWQIADGLMNALAILPINSIRQKAEEISKKHLQPLSDDLDQYIMNKMQTWKTQSGACIKTYADDLSAELNDLCEQFDAHIDVAIKSFDGAEFGQSKRSTTGNLQTAIAVLLGKDMSAVVDINNSGGSISWGQLATKYLGQAVIDSVLSMIAPQAVLLKFGIDALIVAIKAKDSAQKKALLMGEAAIDGYKTELTKNELPFKQGIITNIKDTEEEVSVSARQVLEEQKKITDNLANENKKSEDEEKQIRENLDAVISKMHDKIDDLFEIINGRKPTEKEFNNLGVNEKTVG